MKTVAALFVREDSHYKRIPGVDAYDAARDARTFRGGRPVVAHPPCRAWSKLRRFANPPPGERWLAVWAVLQVRRCGGVLEHPEGSALWKRMGLPGPSDYSDEWGGLTVRVDQFHWGHKARKRTWLYIVGASVLPPMPLRSGEPTHQVTTPGVARRGGRPVGSFKPRLTDSERQLTPPAFAEWLVELARGCEAPRFRA